MKIEIKSRYDGRILFAIMSSNELRAYIDGCHASRNYDSYFDAACREWNSRQ